MKKSPNEISKPEKLLSIDEVAARLRVSTKTVRRHLSAFKFAGLQKVEIGTGRKLVKFREASLDKMIRRAAEFDEPLLKNRKRKRSLAESREITDSGGQDCVRQEAAVAS